MCAPVVGTASTADTGPLQCFALPREAPDVGPLPVGHGTAQASVTTFSMCSCLSWGVRSCRILVYEDSEVRHSASVRRDSVARRYVQSRPSSAHHQLTPPSSSLDTPAAAPPSVIDALDASSSRPQMTSVRLSVERHTLVAFVPCCCSDSRSSITPSEASVDGERYACLRHTPKLTCSHALSHHAARLDGRSASYCFVNTVDEEYLFAS
jgi:hypothetical protein